jgi:dTDP-glucose 4,6-dehydratase
VQAVLLRGRKGEIYNISAAEEKSNLDVVKIILQALGKSEDLVDFVEDRPGHDARYSLDSTKIRTKLHWHPQETFADGIRKTVRWYLQNELWWRPLVDERVLHPAPWTLAW